MFWRAVLLIAAFHSIGNIVGEQFALKFKVLHEAIINCPDRGTDEIQLKWKLVRFNRTLQLLNGHINFNRSIDDAMSLRVKLWTWKNGGWKAGTGLDFKKDRACTSLVSVLGPVWTGIAENAGIRNKCPLKKGSFVVDNLDARVWDKLPLPGAPVNKYKLEFSVFTPDGVNRGCYSSIFRVAPQ